MGSDRTRGAQRPPQGATSLFIPPIHAPISNTPFRLLGARSPSRVRARRYRRAHEHRGVRTWRHLWHSNGKSTRYGMLEAAAVVRDGRRNGVGKTALDQPQSAEREREDRILEGRGDGRSRSAADGRRRRRRTRTTCPYAGLASSASSVRLRRARAAAACFAAAESSRGLRWSVQTLAVARAG